jgi:hypothetical protein
MALKKPTPAAQTSADKFETDPDTVATATAEAPAEAAPKVDAAAAQVETTTAIAKAASTAVGAADDSVARARQFKKEVTSMEDAADFSYGSHRVFKAKDGAIKEMSGDKVKLGRWAKVRLLAWGRHFEISPGDDGKDSAAFVAYSKDGITIDSVIGEEQKEWVGKPVHEYVSYLKDTEEFDKAGRREFLDTQVALMGSESEPGFIEVVQVTLSSSSIPAFRKYQSELEAKARCVEMKLPGFTLPDDPFTFFFVCEDAEKGKNSWTKLRIATTLPTKF